MNRLPYFILEPESLRTLTSPLVLLKQLYSVCVDVNINRNSSRLGSQRVHAVISRLLSEHVCK